MSETLAAIVEGRSGSALSDVLTEAPRLVDSVAEDLATPSANPLSTLSQLLRPSAKPVKSAVIVTDEDDDDEEYVPLTAEEIKTKAESKAQMWGALIAMFFGFIHRYAAYQKLREGDKQLVKEYENQVKTTGKEPDYTDSHPYHAARDRWQEFEEALDEADSDATLTDAQLTLLQRAIEADLRSKNKQGKLKTGSITEVLLELMVIKAMQPLMMGGQAFMSKMVDKSMR